MCLLQPKPMTSIYFLLIYALHNSQSTHGSQLYVSNHWHCTNATQQVQCWAGGRLACSYWPPGVLPPPPGVLVTAQIIIQLHLRPCPRHCRSTGITGLRRTYFLRVWHPDTRPSKQDVPIPWDACMFETEQENYGRHLTVETVELTMWPLCGFICTWCWYAGTESDNKMLTKLRKIKTKYTAADFELGERHLIKNEQVSLDRLRVRQNVFLVM